LSSTIGDFEADARIYEQSPDKVTIPCTDENFQRVLATFQASVHPFLLTPGDNDWSRLPLSQDASGRSHGTPRQGARNVLPGGTQLGPKNHARSDSQVRMGVQAIPRKSNVSYNGVTFATLHIVGSNNNMGRRRHGLPSTPKRTKAPSRG